jgi:hypothetical protein
MNAPMKIPEEPPSPIHSPILNAGKLLFQTYIDWLIHSNKTTTIQTGKINSGIIPIRRAKIDPEINSVLFPSSDGEKYRANERTIAQIRGVMIESWPSGVVMNDKASNLCCLSDEDDKRNPQILGSATGQRGGFSHLMNPRQRPVE